jgi:hypothetical protein
MSKEVNIFASSSGKLKNFAIEKIWSSKFEKAGFLSVLCLCLCFYVTEGSIMYLTDGCSFLISCVIQHYAPVVGWGGGV